MSVTEADAMLLQGETQEATVGGRQADISAAIERQHAYEAGKAAEFGTAAELGPQFLAQAVPLITGGVGLLGAFGGSGYVSPLEGNRLYQIEGGAQTGPFEPQYDRFGNRIPPGARLPVPYEPPPQPGPWAFGVGGIGAILGGVIAGMWEGWPNALGDDEWLGRIPRQGEQGPPPETQQPIPEELPHGPLPESTYGPPGEADPRQIYDPTFPAPWPETLPPPAGDVVLGPTPEVGPPQGTRQPAPAPAPQVGLPPWVWPLIGAIGAISLGRAGRTSVEVPLGPLTALNEPLLPSAPVPDVFSQPYPTTAGFDGGMSGGSDGCNCSPKRGKRRKCLARAQLTWRSGPKKGKAAGSRCYRYAD